MMKCASIFTLALAPFLAAQEAAPQPGGGMEVEPKALAAATWIRGEAPKAWEDGKVYVLECWATWCGPCIAAIPHVNALHQKFADKGLRVMGISVWEDDEAKVRAFVEKRGDRMSYPVAFAGREGPFVKDWLEAFGVSGIPHTFVVKDGKLLFATHPMQLRDEIIEMLLAGDDQTKEAVAAMTRQKVNQDKLQELYREFQLAGANSDTDAMEAALATIDELDPQSAMLPILRLELHSAKKNWEGAAKELATLEGDEALRTLTPFMLRVTREGDKFPVKFRKALAGAFDRLLANESEPDSFACAMLACLKLSLDDREGAIAAAKTAADAAEGQVPREPLDRFVKELEDGKSPGPDDVLGWVREAMKAKGAPDGTAGKE